MNIRLIPLSKSFKNKYRKLKKQLNEYQSFKSCDCHFNDKCDRLFSFYVMDVDDLNIFFYVQDEKCR